MRYLDGFSVKRKLELLSTTTTFINNDLQYSKNIIGKSIN
jgi:hypothetical protein